MADRVKCVRRRPQLEALRQRDEAADAAARRYCPEPDCVIELRPWERSHRGLHSVGDLHQWNMRKRSRDAYDRAGLTSHQDWPAEGPWMWGKVGTPFRLGDLREVRDAALGMVVAAHSRPENIDEYEAVVRRLQAGHGVR